MAIEDVNGVLNIIDQRKKGVGNPDPNGIIPTISKKSDTKLDRYLNSLPGQFVENYRNDPSRTVLGSALGSLIETLTPGVGPGYKKGVGGQAIQNTVPPQEQTPVQPTVVPMAAGGVSPITDKKDVNTLLGKHGGDYYAALLDPAIFSDEQFKGFVNKHEKDIPGIGYVEDPKTKKLTRIASKPQTEEEPMNVTQAEALSKMITAQGHLEAGKGAREQAAVHRSALIAAKGSEDIQKMINSYGKTVGINGEAAVNPELAYFKMGVSGVPLPAGLTKEEKQEHIDAIKQATDPFWSEIAKLEAKYKRKATKAEIGSLATTYQKMRFGI